MDINKAARVQSLQSEVIDAPVETLWSLITNVHDWPLWNKHVSKAKLFGEFAVGQKFIWTSGLVITSHILEVERYKSIVWRGQTFGTRAIHKWGFQPKDHRTEVITEESFEGWLVSLMPNTMQKKLGQSASATTHIFENGRRDVK